MLSTKPGVFSAALPATRFYRVALTMDIMFLVVLSTIFLNFQPLTAIMIVIMSLLDDVPIMTIAYDRNRRGRRSQSAGRCRAC